MKRFCNRLITGIGLAALLSLTGCGDNEPEPKKNPEPEKKKAAAPAPKKKKPAVKTFADSEEGSFKVRYSNSEQEQAKKKSEVRDTQENVSILKKDDPGAAVQQVKISKKEQLRRDSFRTKRPAGSFAALLEPLNSGKVIRWSPQWHSEIASGVRLPAVAISPDRTMIVIAETLGEPQGPFGTRLVFLDTCSWTITAVHHLWKKDVRFIAAAPDHTLVLAARGQEAFKSADEIILLDPRNGREKQVLPLPDVRRVYIDPDGWIHAVFARESEKSNRVKVFSSLLKDGSQTGFEWVTSNHSPVLAFSRDGSQFAVSGDKTVDLFRKSDPHLRPIESTPLPSGFVTADLLIAGDTVIAAPESRLQRRAIAFRNSWHQEFGENSFGLLVPQPDDPEHFFGAVMSRKGRISRIALSTLKEQSGVDPEEGRPRTTGDPKAVFAFPKIKVTAVLDEKGCFYLLYLDAAGKRWQKEILIKSTAAK